MRPDNALTLCSLRWHDPDQVLGSQEYLPLSPSIRTPLVENSIDYGNGFVNSVSAENMDPRGRGIFPPRWGGGRFLNRLYDQPICRERL